MLDSEGEMEEDLTVVVNIQSGSELHEVGRCGSRAALHDADDQRAHHELRLPVVSESGEVVCERRVDFPEPCGERAGQRSRRGRAAHQATGVAKGENLSDCLFRKESFRLQFVLVESGKGSVS